MGNCRSACSATGDCKCNDLRYLFYFIPNNNQSKMNAVLEGSVVGDVHMEVEFEGPKQIRDYGIAHRQCIERFETVIPMWLYDQYSSKNILASSVV